MGINSKAEKPALVYVVRNKNNGKIYIGVTSRIDIRRRWSEHISSAKRGAHNGAFYRAIRKYGKEAFDIEVLSHHDNCASALAAEVFLISKMKPQYNSTSGGCGAPGRIRTRGEIDKLRAVHLGNKYRLGKTHTDDTKKLLSDAAKRNIHNFEKHRHLGPQKVAKNVVCLSDGRIYSSASEAAREYNVSKSALIELCLGKNGRKSVSGLTFSYSGGSNGVC